MFSVATDLLQVRFVCVMCLLGQNKVNLIKHSLKALCPGAESVIALVLQE